MSLSRISEVKDMLPALWTMGMWRNGLPSELQNWGDALGLYVRLSHSQDYLSAGGKYMKYFKAAYYFAPSRNDEDYLVEKLSMPMFDALQGDLTHWKIERFDKDVWEKRFAHLIEPTEEVFFYLIDCMGQRKANTLLPKLVNAVKHFNSTGDWIGLHEHKCISCGRGVSWWPYFHCEPCPHCSGRLRE